MMVWKYGFIKKDKFELTNKTKTTLVQGAKYSSKESSQVVASKEP